MDSVFICYVHPGVVRAEFMQSILAVVRNGSTDIEDVVGVQSGANISRARNSLVFGFMESSESNWLWMIDTDMMFAADTLDRLVKSADAQHRPIIGGLYYRTGDGEGPVPVVFPSHGLPDGLTCVDAVGAGCLLVHRNAFARIAERYEPPAPWFFETIEDGIYYGEDVTFCRRAQRVRLPVYLNADVRVGHVKHHVVGEIQ
jgi:GT2 family glycosyltransferase